MILPGDRAFEAASVCQCVDEICTCALPDKLDMDDFWIVGKGAIAAWGAELYECEALRKSLVTK